MKRALLLLALLLPALVGCGPTLAAQSSPPPGRIASFEPNDDHYDLDLSQGVAIAISCYDDGPCKNVVVSTDDEAIVDVKGAAFGALEQNPYTYQTLTPAGVVLVGKHPGKTKVKVKTKDGSKTIHVTVIAPPRHGHRATAATAATAATSPSLPAPRDPEK